MKELGYKEALNKVFKVRLQRRKIYGDTFKEMEDWELLAAIKSKYKRLEFLLLKNKKNNYENVDDTLIDLINYSLFMLQNKVNKNENIMGSSIKHIK